MITKVIYGTWSVSASLCVYLGMLHIGPIVESAYFPPKINQRVEEITRTRDRLCWVWTNIKVRNLAGYADETTLEFNGDRFDLSVYERDTLMPWTATRAPGLGPQHIGMCVTLPPHIKPGERVVLHQTIMFPGLWGLWALPMHVPDVVDPQ